MDGQGTGRGRGPRHPRSKEGAIIVPNVFSELAQAQASLVEAQAKFLYRSRGNGAERSEGPSRRRAGGLDRCCARDLEQQIEMKRLTVVEYHRALDALHQEQARIANEIKVVDERGSNLLLFNQYEGLPADLVSLAWIGGQYFLSKASEIAHWAAAASDHRGNEDARELVPRARQERSAATRRSPDARKPRTVGSD